MVSEIGFSDVLSLAQTIGIVGTLVLTLYFSKRHIHSLSIGQQTRVLNDLDEKFHKMAEIIMADPSVGMRSPVASRTGWASSSRKRSRMR